MQRHGEDDVMNMGHDESGVDEQEIPDALKGQVAATGERGGRGYLYRPGELFVRAAALDAPAVTKAIDRFELEAEEVSGDASLVLLTMPSGSDGAESVPDIVDQINRSTRADDKRVPVAQPNHALFATTHKIFGPATKPRRGRFSWGHLPPARGAAGEGVTIGVIDTGAVEHPVYADRLTVPAPHREVLHRTLQPAEGHGTFITGVILRHAPGATVRPIRVLSSFGHIDDRSLADAVRANSDVDILNLSLGCYTDHDTGLASLPGALAAAWIDNPRLLVVAAAGNAGVRRRFYPAAYPGVIGVAALGPDGKRARFSNYGPWVSACAPGVDIRGPFVDGRAAGAPPDVWAEWSGTSFAAPYVAAAIAAEVDQLTPAPLVWLLKSMLFPKPDMGIEITTPAYSVP